MFPPPSLNREERRLLGFWRGLGDADRATLLRFAEYLAQDSSGETPGQAEPLDLPRPAEETVVAAIRRLTATYPMIDKDRLLHQTSGLMTQHVMQGRAAADVIDELEQLFERHYQLLRDGTSD